MNTIGARIFKYSSIESTNIFVKNNMQELGLENGDVVIADYQEKGRGHQDNYWESEAHKNLTFSILLWPHHIHPMQQFYLTRFVSLALVDYLSLLDVEACIKWPNDIYIGDHKIGGILVENSIMGDHIQSSVIGIGININQESFQSDAPNPISLKQLTQKTYHLDKELRDLMHHLNIRYKQLSKNNMQLLSEEYEGKLYRMSVLSKFILKGKEILGTIVGVNEIGQLILEMQDRSIQKFNFKEIQFV